MLMPEENATIYCNLGDYNMAQSEDLSPKEEAETPSFEDSFIRLSEMAEQLEAGGLSLAEATARFEEGMKLVALMRPSVNRLHSLRSRCSLVRCLSPESPTCVW